MNYAEKLKDPRWQKKRLEILERDGWECKICGDLKETLNVHHKIYNGCNPWEIENKSLVSLCDYCHEKEPEEVAKLLKDINHSLKILFTSSDLLDISEGLHKLTDNIPPEVISRSLNRYMVDEELLAKICCEYLELIKKYDKKTTYKKHITSIGNLNKINNKNSTLS